MIRKFAFLYLIFDVLLICVCIYKGVYWLINSQVAFIGSMLIVFSSFYGYKKAVDTKSVLIKEDDFDEELEDKEIIKKTKKLANTFKTSFSPFRLLSYGFLILSFLYLNRHGWLEIAPFLLGLGILPIASLFLSFKKF